MLTSPDHGRPLCVHHKQGDSQAEEDFRKATVSSLVESRRCQIVLLGVKISEAVLQLAVTGGGWPADFKRRLRYILEGRCQAFGIVWA